MTGGGPQGADANEPLSAKQRWIRIIDRISSVVPTMRGRLSALVVVALVPALDHPRLRRVAAAAAGVCRARRSLDPRGPADAARARRPDHADGSPAGAAGSGSRRDRARPRRRRATLVDALRADRLYNNVLIVDGSSGEVRASAVPLDKAVNARELLAFQRARHTLDFASGAFLPEPATARPGLNLAQPVINDVGKVTCDRLGEPRSRLGVRFHRALRPSEQHRPDGAR